MVHSVRAGATSMDRKAVRICEAQARLMLAPHSTIVARIVAALTHELNSPLGTMLSSLEYSSRGSRKNPRWPTSRYVQTGRP